MIGSPATSIDARHSGTFRVGGAIEINRLGCGAMRITGRGIWGPPADEAEALRTLKRLPQLGVNFIDTADSYGPDVSEQRIHKALHPYSGLSGSVLDVIAKQRGAAPSQVALAWILKRSPVMLPIPGTSKVAHLEENVVAASITLTDAEFAALDRAGR